MKKVLVITYYWPPSGGPGVQRVLKFIKYFPEFGWEPIVLTVDKGNYPSIDESLVHEIPSACKVYKTKAFEPFDLYKTLSGKTKNESIPTFVLNKSESDSIFDKAVKWMRANVFVPDAKTGWINYIIKEGQRIIEKEKPDLIFSSSPPHSLQIGAMKLAQKTKLRWAADFRDPWCDAFWQKDIPRTKYAKTKDQKYEQSVLSSADAIITVSDSIAEDFKRKAAHNFYVIPNGFDTDDFIFEKEKNKKFTITYTGTLAESQKIDNLLKALPGLEGKIKNEFQFNLFGTFHPSILKTIRESNLPDIINIYPDVPHKDVIKIMLNSDVLLLVIPDAPNNKGILTGKIFEYMAACGHAARNFILGIGPIDGDAAKILIETNCGQMFGYNDDLLAVILDQYNKFISGSKLKINAALPQEEALTKYSRRNLTRQLVDVFEALT